MTMDYPAYPPAPEIRIQMRLNIITDAGAAEMVMGNGSNGQTMNQITGGKPIPAIAQTPHIQSVDTSADERGHGRNRRPGDGRRDHHRSKNHHHHHHHHDRSKHGSSSTSKHDDRPSSRPSSHRDRDGPSSSSRRHRSSSRHRTKERSGGARSGGETTEDQSIDDRSAEILEPPSHDESTGFEVSGTTPDRPAYPSFGAAGRPGHGFGPLRPLDSDLPEELSFNEDLVQPPVVVAQGPPVPQKPSVLSNSGGNFTRNGLPSGHYIRTDKGLVDDSMDSLEMSIDRRLGKFGAPQPQNGRSPDKAGPLAKRGYAGDFINHWPLRESSSSSELVHDAQTPQDHSRFTGPAPPCTKPSSTFDPGLVQTVKSILTPVPGRPNDLPLGSDYESQPFANRRRANSYSSLREPERRGSSRQGGQETTFDVVKPAMSKAKKFGSQEHLASLLGSSTGDVRSSNQSLDSSVANDHRSQHGHRTRSRNPSERSAETTFLPSNGGTSASGPAQSPSISVHSSYRSLPEKPGILKAGRVVTTPSDRPSVETTFGVEETSQESSQNASVTNESRDQNSRDQESRDHMIEVLSKIENKMQSLLLDQDRALRESVSCLAEKVDRAQTPLDMFASRQDLEEEIRPQFENLEEKITHMLAEREKQINSTIQHAMQVANLRNENDALLKETKAQQFESRLQKLFEEKEGEFKVTIANLLDQISKKVHTPSPPPPEPRSSQQQKITEQLVKDQPSPKHYIHSIPYRRPYPDGSGAGLVSDPSHYNGGGSPRLSNQSTTSVASRQSGESVYDVPTPRSSSDALPPLPQGPVYSKIYEYADNVLDRARAVYETPNSLLEQNVQNVVPRPSGFDARLQGTTTKPPPALIVGDPAAKGGSTDDRKPESTAFPRNLSASRPRASQNSDTSATTPSGVNKASSAAIFDLYTAKRPGNVGVPSGSFNPTRKPATFGGAKAGSSVASTSTITDPKSESTVMTEENPDDYLLQRQISPPSLPALAQPESGTISPHESVVSEASLRADQSAPFYETVGGHPNNGGINYGDPNNVGPRSAASYSVRFRDDISDIESKLRQKHGSIASSVTSFTNSDCGIPLAGDYATFLSDQKMTSNDPFNPRVALYQSKTVEYTRTEETTSRVETGVTSKPSGNGFGPNSESEPVQKLMSQDSSILRSDSIASTATVTGYAQPEGDQSMFAQNITQSPSRVGVFGSRAQPGNIAGKYSYTKPTEL